ncbi:MAG: hypothetical protein MN733_01440 [Nitrososphaera sp.]|nr:hypothetical protein [Nitrososphaera sp.]
MAKRRHKHKQKKATEHRPVQWNPVKKPGFEHMPICKTCKKRPTTDARKTECPICAKLPTSTGNVADDVDRKFWCCEV